MRRIRDFDTGSISYFDENEEQIGSGLMSDLASNLWSKITSDTSQKLAKIAAEKAISKGSEKIGEKVGEKIGEKISKKIEGKKNNKIDDKINNEPNITTELGGKKIVELLQQYNKKPNKPHSNKYIDISQKFDELLS